MERMHHYTFKNKASPVLHMDFTTLKNNIIRPSPSDIARESELWIKEWAHWKPYHAILTYNLDKSGVLYCYRNSYDSDPFRMIQMSDLIQLRENPVDSQTFYEFSALEKNGLSIVLATKSLGERSAWLTSLGMFIKVTTAFSNEKNETQELESESIETRDNSNKMMEMIQNMSLQMELQGKQFQEWMSSSSLQSNRMNPMINSSSNTKGAGPMDKSDKLLLLGLQDRLIQVQGNTDYMSDRLLQTLKRDQDVLNLQKDFKNLVNQVETYQVEMDIKLSCILELLSSRDNSKVKIDDDDVDIKVIRRGESHETLIPLSPKSIS